MSYQIFQDLPITSKSSNFYNHENLEYLFLFEKIIDYKIDDLKFMNMLKEELLEDFDDMNVKNIFDRCKKNWIKI